MRISDWSSDVCSSDLDRLASLGDIAGSIEDQRPRLAPVGVDREPLAGLEGGGVPAHLLHRVEHQAFRTDPMEAADALLVRQLVDLEDLQVAGAQDGQNVLVAAVDRDREVLARGRDARSEEHTSELQSLLRISYAVFCLKK